MYLYNPVMISSPFFMGVGKGVKFLFNCKMAISIIKNPKKEIHAPRYFITKNDWNVYWIRGIKKIVNNINWMVTLDEI